MSLPAAQRLRPESCLSDLALERLLTGELTAAGERAQAEGHLAGCGSCRRRRDELAAEPAQRPDPAFWRQQTRRPPASPRARRLAGGLVAAAAMAALVLLVVRPKIDQPAVPGAGDETRAKGGAFALELVARRSDGRTLPVFDGTALRPGDAVRFVVTAPEAGPVAVVGLDAGGHVSVYAPAAPDAALTAPAGTHELPGSIVLDETLGDERFVALQCTAAPARAALIAAGQRALAAAGGQPARTGALDLPCRQTGLTIRKDSPR